MVLLRREDEEVGKNRDAGNGQRHAVGTDLDRPSLVGHRLPGHTKTTPYQNDKTIRTAYVYRRLPTVPFKPKPCTPVHLITTIEYNPENHCPL